MGERDIVNLNKIYRFANDFCRLSSFPFHFEEDTGYYETAIVFDEEKKSNRRPNINETWNNIPYPECMICCDILDYSHKIIFEYEEEGQKKRPRAKLSTKGHGREGDIPNKRDTRRNKFYDDNQFYFLRIWESDFKVETVWRIILMEFLIQRYKNSQEKINHE